MRSDSTTKLSGFEQFEEELKKTHNNTMCFFPNKTDTANLNINIDVLENTLNELTLKEVLAKLDSSCPTGSAKLEIEKLEGDEIVLTFEDNNKKQCKK